MGFGAENGGFIAKHLCALRGVEQGSRGVSPGSPSRLQDRFEAPALNNVQQNERWASRPLFVAFELRNIPHGHMKVVRKHGLLMFSLSRSARICFPVSGLAAGCAAPPR
jgi:hypothetical protein